MNLDKQLEDFTRASESLKTRAVKSVRDNFALVLLLLNIAVNVALRLFSPELQNPFNEEFFISLTLNVVTTTFAYSSFIAYAEKKTKVTLIGYAENCERWSVISQEVRRTHNKAFSEYCKRVSREERESRRRAAFENSTMMDYDEYLKKYTKKSAKLIDAAVESGELSPEDAKAIKRANKQLRLKTIDPLWILCGVKTMDLSEARNGKFKSSTLSMLSRPFSMFAMSALAAALHGTYVGVTTGEEVYAMIVSVGMIVISSVMGYSAGVNSVKKEHDKIKNRIAFIERFEEERKNAPHNLLESPPLQSHTPTEETTIEEEKTAPAT